ncbi:MAG: betaine/proline/choline family ABC transporter ATP-binding protein [Planctomycetaceae bacterium]|nr:betaine/proline/choline family ABC transporter ATP-binding protein [Planctomycetaceae bacterium]
MIRFENVRKSYKKTTVLNNVNFEIEAGTFTVLIGPSGCGKTTSLKMINRLIEPDAGRILIKGEYIHSLDRIRLRRSIGYVIQQIGLFPNMTVEQNIAVVPKLLKYQPAQITDMVHELLAMVKMPYKDFAGKYPYQLSGGQQQRIGVLRALAASPPIILMDEPFAALDPMTRSSLQDEVKNLQQQLNKTIVFVTHDMDEALNLADKIIFLDKGNIVQMASPEEMLENPATNLIRSFMGKRIGGPDQPPEYAADFMRTNYHRVNKNKGIRECIESMDRNNVDSLLVVNDDKTYAGTVSLKTLKNSAKSGVFALKRKGSDGKLHHVITPHVTCERPTSFIDEEARVCFEKLLETDSRYVVVLNHDDTIAGIVTDTSVAKALADVFWSDEI